MPADAPPLTADPRRVWTRRLAWAGAGLALLWLVSWLALPASASVNGQSIAVDGGEVMTG